MNLLNTSRAASWPSASSSDGLEVTAAMALPPRLEPGRWPGPEGEAGAAAERRGKPGGAHPQLGQGLVLSLLPEPVEHGAADPPGPDVGAGQETEAAHHVGREAQA